MCIICVDLAKDRMTTLEAKRALGEMIEEMDPEHAKEVMQAIETKETAASASDED